MSNQEVETSSSKSDLLLVTLAALLAIAGVVGFALLSEEALAIRLGVLGGGLVLAVIIAWFSPSGKRFLNLWTAVLGRASARCMAHSQGNAQYDRLSNGLRGDYCVFPLHLRQAD